MLLYILQKDENGYVAYKGWNFIPSAFRHGNSYGKIVFIINYGNYM